LLARIDAFVGERHGERLPPLMPETAPTEIDLRSAGIKTVLWATGFSRRYPWLRVPVLDERGEVRHSAGVTPEPGLYVLGLFFLRRRNSSFIDGVGADALELSRHIARRLNGGRHAVA
jgi:putative flavoprotein involved in K+ transport